MYIYTYVYICIHVYMCIFIHGNISLNCAIHCNTLQHTATHCNTLQNAALHGNISYDFEIIVLQCDVECCSMLQHVTCKEQLHVTRRKTKVILRTNRTKQLKDKRAAVCCSVLQCVAVCCSALQCVAVRCSALQCVAVCCNVLQCLYHYNSTHTSLQTIAMLLRRRYMGWA